MTPDPRVRLSADKQHFILYFVGSQLRFTSDYRGFMLMRAVLAARQRNEDVKIGTEGRPIQWALDKISLAIGKNTTEDQIEGWLAAGGVIKRKARTDLMKLKLELGSIEVPSFDELKEAK